LLLEYRFLLTDETNIELRGLMGICGIIYWASKLTEFLLSLDYLKILPFYIDLKFYINPAGADVLFALFN
jgi:hypothetical protein